MKILGNLNIEKGSHKEYESVTEAGGDIDVRQGANFSAPALQKSGDIYVYKGANFSAPALQESGYIFVSQGASFSAPALQESGYIFVSQGASFSAPACLFKNSQLFYENKFYNLKHVDGIFCAEISKTTKMAIEISEVMLNFNIKDGKLLFDTAFVASKEGINSHGKTIKEAIKDLLFKELQRKMANEPIEMDTIVTTERYRAITGA